MSVFAVILLRIFPHWDWILCTSPYSVRMQENRDQNNSKYGQFHAVNIVILLIINPSSSEFCNSNIALWILKQKLINSRKTNLILLWFMLLRVEKSKVEIECAFFLELILLMASITDWLLKTPSLYIYMVL